MISLTDHSIIAEMYIGDKCTPDFSDSPVRRKSLRKQQANSPLLSRLKDSFQNDLRETRLRSRSPTPGISKTIRHKIKRTQPSPAPYKSPAQVPPKVSPSKSKSPSGNNVLNKKRQESPASATPKSSPDQGPIRVKYKGKNFTCDKDLPSKKSSGRGRKGHRMRRNSNDSTDSAPESALAEKRKIKSDIRNKVLKKSVVGKVGQKSGRIEQENPLKRKREVGCISHIQRKRGRPPKETESSSDVPYKELSTTSSSETEEVRKKKQQRMEKQQDSTKEVNAGISSKEKAQRTNLDSSFEDSSELEIRNPEKDDMPALKHGFNGPVPLALYKVEDNKDDVADTSMEVYMSPPKVQIENLEDDDDVEFMSKEELKESLKSVMEHEMKKTVYGEVSSNALPSDSGNGISACSKQKHKPSILDPLQQRIDKDVNIIPSPLSSNSAKLPAYPLSLSQASSQISTPLDLTCPDLTCPIGQHRPGVVSESVTSHVTSVFSSSISSMSSSSAQHSPPHSSTGVTSASDKDAMIGSSEDFRVFSSGNTPFSNGTTEITSPDSATQGAVPAQVKTEPGLPLCGADLSSLGVIDLSDDDDEDISHNAPQDEAISSVTSPQSTQMDYGVVVENIIVTKNVDSDSEECNDRDGILKDTEIKKEIETTDSDKPFSTLSKLDQKEADPIIIIDDD